MEHNVEPNVFFDGCLSDYEKTMYSMAIAFSASEHFQIRRDDIDQLAVWLSLDFDLLRKALNYCPDGRIPYKKIKLGDCYFDRQDFRNAELFEALVHVYFVYKDLAQISDGVSHEALQENYLLFQDAIGLFSILNMLTSTFECMSNDCFSRSYAVYNNGSFQPQKQLNLLHIGLVKRSEDVIDKAFFPFLCRVMSYELVTRVNAIYLIAIAQTIKHSAFFDERIKAIASEMYLYLLGLAQNARVISAQTNYLPVQHSDNPESRGRYDNTTRLQVLYGYENFDTYFLRLDLAHKGQGFIHFNNRSPGGVKCCLFNQNEYQSIVAKSPGAREFFVEYDRRYALKEPHNLELTDEEAAVYDSIRRNKEHEQAFVDTYAESTVEDFIRIFGTMLPASSRVCIDVEEQHAKCCFQYEKLMFWAVLLEIAILSRDEEQQKKALDTITLLAVMHGIISEQERCDYACLEGACMIIDAAKQRIALYQQL